MALKGIRWLGALIAGALLLSVVILRSDREDASVSADWSRARRLDRLASHAQSAAQRLRAASLLDSVGALSSAPKSEPHAVRVLLDPTLPDTARAAYEAIARRSAAGYAGPERVGVDIAYIYDTTRMVGRTSIPRTASMAWYVLPARAGDRCSVVVQLSQEATTARWLARARGNRATTSVLGPCAYYRAFGIPGARVDEWLRQRGWGMAGAGSWRESVDPAPPEGSQGYFSAGEWHDRSALAGESSLPFLLEMSMPALHCAAGTLADCGEALRTSRQRRIRIWNGNVILGGYSTGRGFSYYRQGFSDYSTPPLGYRESHLLADMVRTLGPEKFARFWSSSEPMPLAFAMAAGEPLDQWTSRWMKSHYGEVPPLGAGLTPWSAMMSGLYLSLSVLVAVRVGARRQYV